MYINHTTRIQYKNSNKAWSFILFSKRGIPIALLIAKLNESLHKYGKMQFQYVFHSNKYLHKASFKITTKVKLLWMS